MILHRPFWYDEPGKPPARPRVANPVDPSYGSKVRFTRLPDLRPKSHLSIGSNSYALKRGRSEHVRLMPAEQEVEYRSIEAEIEALQLRLRAVVDEAWVRAEPYIHEESSK